LIHFDEWNGKKQEGIFPLKEHKFEVYEKGFEVGDKTKNMFSNFFSKIRGKPKTEEPKLEEQEKPKEAPASAIPAREQPKQPKEDSLY